MRAPITDKHLLEMMWERFPEIMGRGVGQPAQRTWVGLTQQDIDIAFDDTQEGGGFDDFARAIETKLKEKNCD